MNDSVRVAVAQMCSNDSVEDNLATAKKLADSAKAKGVELLVYPENFAQMAANSSEQYIESWGQGKVQEAVIAWAKEAKMTIVLGSLAVQTDSSEKPFARSIMVSSAGGVIGYYDKVHLFDVDISTNESYRESDTYRHGSISQLELATSSIEACGSRIGLSICYDLRFPELYRKLNEHGTEVVCVPAAFTENTGRAHWQCLLKARAIENQMFVLAAAQSGHHSNGRNTWGHSMIIDPWGEILALIESEVGLVTADLDLSQLHTLREKFPAQKHRKL